MDWCPWSGWAAPNIIWCEEQRACSWVVTPLNAYSNLAYVVCAVLAWRALNSSKSNNNNNNNNSSYRVALRLFPLAALFVGVSSFLYHASVTFAFQMLDFAAMHIFLSLPLDCALRLRFASLRHTRALSVALCCAVTAALCTAAMAMRQLPYQSLVAIQICILLALLGHTQLTTSAPLQTALTLLIAAAAASAADATRLLCQPQSVLQGHAVWHLLSAAAMYYLTIHFKLTADKQKL